ncbi:hypothetical protein ACMYSO_05245 [Klebsiella sp. B345]
MATVKAATKGYLSLIASPLPSMAKTQRVSEHASPIYKTPFLL